MSRCLAGGGDEEVGDLPDDVARGDQAQEGQVGARPVRPSNHPTLVRAHAREISLHCCLLQLHSSLSTTLSLSSLEVLRSILATHIIVVDSYLRSNIEQVQISSSRTLCN